jgi:hypothetical protein
VMFMVDFTKFSTFNVLFCRQIIKISCIINAHKMFSLVILRRHSM